MAKRFINLFYLVIFICLIGFLIFIITIRPNTKKYSQEVLEKLMDMINTKLEKIRDKNIELLEKEKVIVKGFTNALPFTIKDSLSNVKIMKNLNYVVNEFSLYKFKNDKIDMIQDLAFLDPIKNFRHINIWLLTNMNSKQSQNEIISSLKNYITKSNINLKINLKTVFHNDDVSNDTLYKEISILNSSYLVGEIMDQGALNVLVKINIKKTKEEIDEYNYSRKIFEYKQSKKNLINTFDDLNNEEYFYFNPDFNKEILVTTLDSIVDRNSFDLISLIYYNYLNNQFNNNKIKLASLVSFDNLKDYFYYRMLLQSVKNLNILNNFIVHYESIKNIENLKIEYNKINSLIKSIVNSKLQMQSFGQVQELYFISILLLDSNDLIVYDHFFSNEFKIGMFVPVMLPLLYGFFKSLKYVLSKN